MSQQIPTIGGKPLNINQIQNPAMQGQGSDAVNQAQQAANNSYLANRAKASQDADPATTLGLTTAIGYGIGQGMDVFNKKSGGEYEKSIFGRLGGWADAFSKNTRVGRAIENSLQKINAYITLKSRSSKILYALKHHATMPDWKIVKQMGSGLKGFLGTDTENVFEHFMKPIDGNFQKLEQYGMSQEEINNFRRSLTGTKAEQVLELQKKELEKLGASASEVAGKTIEELKDLATELKAKKLGFANLAEYNFLKGNFVDNPNVIRDVLEKADKNIKISVWRGDGSTLFGKLKSHFLGRTVSLSELYNKYNVILGKGNKSYLGRALPKALAWITEGGTNRFAGGKLAPFMQAFFFADMLYHAVKAPVGEKIKTFAERVVNDFTYFIGGIAGVVGMHKLIGCFKYIGNNDAGREAYRAALKAFNEQVKAKAFASKADYNAAGKAVDALLNTDGLKWYQKILQKAACIMNMGNEHKLAYRSNKLINNNFLRRVLNTNILGVPLRFALPMIIVSPFLAKLTTKAAHLIFGRPTHSVLDEETEEETSKQKDGIKKPENQSSSVTQTAKADPNSYADTNLIKRRANKQNSGSHESNDVTKTEKNNDKNVEPVRTYIPSPVGMVQTSPDRTAYDNAMSKADSAEKEIEQILANYR